MRSCKWSLLLLAVGAVALFGLQGLAQAALIVQHVGTTNPTTEGFSQYMVPAATAYQAAGSELATPCWAIYSYPADNECNFAISSSQADAMNANGWKLTVKAYDWWATANPASVNAVDFQVVTANKMFRINLATAGDSGGGNQTPYMLTSSGTLEAVGNALSNAWHTYVITAAAGASSATFSVDGGTAVTMDGFSGTFSPTVDFGSFSTTSGYGEFALIRLETLETPEPSTLVLLTTAASGLLCYAWRRRK